MALLRTDALSLVRDRLALGALIVGLLAALLAAAAGHAWADHLGSSMAESSQAAREAASEARADWASAGTLDAEEAALLPGRLWTYLELRQPVLADFSAGRSVLEPTSANVRLATRPDAVFSRYQVGNPERLARGGLDLSFLAVVLAPLLLIAVGYGVFAVDRDAGTARLWLAQAGSPLRLLAARSVNRLALAFLPVGLAGLALWTVGPDDRGGALLTWLAVALLGLLFWWALILFVNSIRVSAETAALTLVGLWTLLVFVVPAVAGAAAAIINPPPSRFEQIAVARAAEVRASRVYDDDHPELAASSLEGRRASVEKGIEVRAAVSAAIAPLQEEHRRQMAAQHVLAERLSLLSPPALVADALAAIAQTDANFYDAQRQAAVAHLKPLGRALADAALGRVSIDATTFDSLPRFEPPQPPRIRLNSAIWVLAVTFIFAALALVRIRRARQL